MRKHEQISESLNDTEQFPWHGVARCSDGSVALVFPFLRATWELLQHNQELERARIIKAGDFFVASYFQDRWVRVCKVINKLAQLEIMILSDQHHLKSLDANQELPYWLDLFHLYFPMLLDATVVALGQIISDAPSSFPREFKSLFKEGLNIDGMKLRCAEKDFLEMIKRNRSWYDQIRPKKEKSVRDSIVHRLSKWQITTHTEINESSNIVLNKTLKAHLQGEGSDISSEDSLNNTKRFLIGFCSFLSSLPSETWISNKFDRRDLKTADDENDIGGRFLPLLPDVIQIN